MSQPVLEVPSIALVGPGGAGKTTAGMLLAERLSVPFVDLDRRFNDRAGDISRCIEQSGYRAYARDNVKAYRSLIDERRSCGVIALSSGCRTAESGGRILRRTS